MIIAIGSDHAALAEKAALVAHMQSLGHAVVDVGTHTDESCDYPDFAAAVCRDVASGKVNTGILVCGTGIGMSMAANKFDGIRAAVCHDEFTARMAREHNDANVLCLGARIMSIDAMSACVGVFLTTGFGGGRHARRVDKITALERSSVA